MAHTLQKLPENKTKFLQNGLITENANIYSCKFISFYSIYTHQCTVRSMCMKGELRRFLKFWRIRAKYLS